MANLTASELNQQEISAQSKWEMATPFWYNLRSFKNTNYQKKAATVKLNRKQVQRKSRTLPKIQFADQRLSSFSGLLLFQVLFNNLNLRDRLRACFRHVKAELTYDFALQFLCLIVHALLGYRKLRESAYYRDDPLVLRLLGLKRLPDVATISRTLSGIAGTTVERLRELLHDLVLERLAAFQIRQVTLNFDGSALGTCRRAEGTAVGYNRRKKGQRSYYPLFCTMAQTGQVFDFLHRPGTVHESKGAQEAIFAELKTEGQMDCITVKKLLGNQAAMLTVICAHNLNRELQTHARPPQRQTTAKRPPIWKFERLATLRRRLVQQAGRLTRPQGRLTLTLSQHPAIKHDFLTYLGQHQAAS